MFTILERLDKIERMISESHYRGRFGADTTERSDAKCYDMTKEGMIESIEAVRKTGRRKKGGGWEHE